MKSCAKRYNFLYYLPVALRPRSLVVLFAVSIFSALMLSLSAPLLAHAVTMKLMPEEIRKLEKEYNLVKLELRALKAKHSEMTKEYTPLNIRAEYVRDILDLRLRMVGIEERRRKLYDDLKRMPKGPPLMKLVEIKTPMESGRSIEYTHNAQGAGFSAKINDEDDSISNHNISLRVLKAPLKFNIDQPFEIKINVRERISYREGHACIWRADSKGPRSTRAVISSMNVVNASALGTGDLNSYCNEGAMKKIKAEHGEVRYVRAATDKESRVVFKVKFSPSKRDIRDGRQEYYYRASSEGEVVGSPIELEVDTERPMLTFDLATDKEGFLRDFVNTYDEDGRRVGYGIKIEARVPLLGALELYYEPVHRGDPALNSLNVPAEPSEFFKPLRDGEVSAIVKVPNVLGVTTEDALDILKARGLVAQLQPGSMARTSFETGRVEAQNPKAGRDISAGAQVAIKIFSPYVELKKVPNLVDMKSDQAIGTLAGLDLLIETKPGKPPASEEESNIVERQNPKAGAMIARASTVVLWIKPFYVKKATLPLLVGMVSGDAMGELRRLELKAHLIDGPPATNEYKAGRVRRQRPEAGTELLTGSDVFLTVYGPYIKTAKVPMLTGLSYIEAQKAVEGLGLRFKWNNIGPAHSGSTSERVIRQNPEAGVNVRLSSLITVDAYGQFVPPARPAPPRAPTRGRTNTAGRGQNKAKSSGATPAQCEQNYASIKKMASQGKIGKSFATASAVLALASGCNPARVNSALTGAGSSSGARGSGGSGGARGRTKSTYTNCKWNCSVFSNSDLFGRQAGAKQNCVCQCGSAYPGSEACANIAKPRPKPQPTRTTGSVSCRWVTGGTCGAGPLGTGSASNYNSGPCCMCGSSLANPSKCGNIKKPGQSSACHWFKRMPSLWEVSRGNSSTWACSCKPPSKCGAKPSE